MIRHGKAPYLECSSAGDKRFSALFAMVDGKSIEQHYQESKNLGGKWQSAKGKPASAESKQLYVDLWRQYLKQNPQLIKVLLMQTGLSDQFGQVGHMCQATVLWRLRFEYLLRGSI